MSWFHCDRAAPLLWPLLFCVCLQAGSAWCFKRCFLCLGCFSSFWALQAGSAWSSRSCTLGRPISWSRRSPSRKSRASSLCHRWSRPLSLTKCPIRYGPGPPAQPLPGLVGGSRAHLEARIGKLRRLQGLPVVAAAAGAAASVHAAGAGEGVPDMGCSAPAHCADAAGPAAAGGLRSSRGSMGSATTGALCASSPATLQPPSARRRKTCEASSRASSPRQLGVPTGPAAQRSRPPW